MHIWIEGVLAARFEPFTRNSTEATVVDLPLNASGSEVSVVTEDMADRDTIWFFELSQLDDASVVVTLPGATAETESLTLAQLAAEVRCAGEYVLDGPVRLVFDRARPTRHHRGPHGSTSHDRSSSLECTVTLGDGEGQSTFA